MTEASGSSPGSTRSDRRSPTRFSGIFPTAPGGPDRPRQYRARGEKVDQARKGRWIGSSLQPDGSSGLLQESALRTYKLHIQYSNDL